MKWGDLWPYAFPERAEHRREKRYVGGAFIENIKVRTFNFLQQFICVASRWSVIAKMRKLQKKGINVQTAEDLELYWKNNPEQRVDSKYADLDFVERAALIKEKQALENEDEDDVHLV